MNYIQHIFASTLIALSVVTSSLYFSTAAQSQPLPIDRLVTVGRLDNGMKFLFRPTESAGVDIRLVVNTGALDEADDEMGYAHFVEHLAFRKTKRFRDGEIIEFVRSLGGSFGQHLNAFTSHNQTQYWITLPAGKVDALPKAIQILRDWASNIEFSDDIINIERGVVASEKRSRDQSTQPVFKIRQALYDQGLYRREIVGTFDTIANANAAKLSAFYKRTYTPDRMSIVVSGQLPDGAGYWQRKINDEFGAKGAFEAIPPVRPSFNFENRVRILQLTDGQRPSISLVTLFRQTIGTQREDFAKWLLRTVATGALNQRLREAAKLQPWTLDQTAADFALAQDARAFELVVAINDKSKFLDGYALVREVLEKFLREGPTPEELEAVTRPILRNARTSEEESAKVTPPAIGANLAMYAHSGGYYLSSSQYRALVEEEIKKISPEAAVKSIAERFDNQDLLVIVQGQRNDPTPKLDEKELIATSTAFASTLRTAASTTTAKTLPISTAIASNLALPPPLASGSIVKEEELTNEIIRLTLSNNAVVYVRPIRTATVDQVVFSAKRPKGLWSLAEGQIPGARIAQSGGWLTHGIGPFDQTTFARELSARNINFRVAMGNTDTSFGARMRSGDLPFTLHLFHQFLREPKFDQQNYDRLQARTKPIMTAQNLAPEQQFSVQWRQSRYGTSPWLDSLKETQFDSVSFEQLKNLHGEIFGDASQFVFAFTGNVSLRDIRRLSETYLANLPASGDNKIGTQKWAPISQEKQGVRLEVKTAKAERATIQFRYVNQTIQDSLELGGTGSQMQSILSNRLRLALRQDTGLTYSPSASIQALAAPLNGVFITIDVTVAVGDIAKTEEAIRATVQSLTVQPPTNEELSAFRESYATANRNLLAEPNNVAELLLTLHLRNVSIDELQRVRQNVLTRDPQTMMANFKTILNGIEPSVGIHKPEEK
jgi:zinc protease